MPTCRMTPLPQLTRDVNTTAARLGACAEELEEMVVVIRRSFDTPGSTGAKLRAVLHKKVLVLEALASLCRLSGQRLSDLLAASRGRDARSALAGMQSLGRSLAGRLHQEAQTARRVLDLVRAEAARGAQPSTRAGETELSARGMDSA